MRPALVVESYTGLVVKAETLVWDILGSSLVEEEEVDFEIGVVEDRCLDLGLREA